MIKPRQKTPNLKVSLVNNTKWILSEQNPKHFTLIVFYRGKHCPVCKKQLEDLQKNIHKFEERGVHVIAISANTKELAEETHKEWDIENVPVGYNFSIDDARKWGLFITKAIKEKEPDVFFEPGIFLIDTEQKVYWQSIQSMPFGRPKFREILNGIDYILNENYPARGEA